MEEGTGDRSPTLLCQLRQHAAMGIEGGSGLQGLDFANIKLFHGIAPFVEAFFLRDHFNRACLVVSNRQNAFQVTLKFRIDAGYRDMNVCWSV